MDAKMIPQVINNFNVYDDDANRLVGTTDEVTLPNLNPKTTTTTGAGVLGDIEWPTLGQLDSMELTINFNMLSKQYFTIAGNTNGASGLTLRGSMQLLDPAKGSAKNYGIRIVTRGVTKSATNGSMKKSDAMGASIVRELTYYMVEIDGENVVEVDKLNSVYKVNGVDMLADINNQI